MRWKAYRDKRKRDLDGWFIWFAWHPIQIDDTRVWLENVHRRIVIDRNGRWIGCRWHNEWHNEYKFI
jgi:hypothetical protein